MENYLHPNAIQSFYAGNGTIIALPDSFDDFDDVPEIVAQALHLSSNNLVGWSPWESLEDEDKRKKSSRVKKNLNLQIPVLMTHELRQYADRDDEVIGWLNAINELVGT